MCGSSMTELRVSFDGIKDGMAQLTLYINGDVREYFHTSLDNMPAETGLGDQFTPLLDDGTVVGLQYDRELSERKHEKGREAIETYNDMLEER